MDRRIVFQILEIHYALNLGRANPLLGTPVALYPSSGWHLSGTSALSVVKLHKYLYQMMAVGKLSTTNC